MSKPNAIKTFRDLLSFLTIIPLAKTEEFVETSARNLWLFPLIGGLIGLLAAGYFFAGGFIVSYLVLAVNYLTHLDLTFLTQFVPAAMTIAFLLVLTGFQHFDGLVDLGNAIGLKRVEDRREIAHRWVVTYKGGFLALIVEFLAFAGIFLISWSVAGGFVAIRTLIIAEICAKTAMVTIVWRGKPAHAGLGSRFLMQAKRRLNFAGYGLAYILGFMLLGIVGGLVVSVALLFGLFMEWVGKVVFGGVSGDMIGATNEAARATSLIFVAVLSIVSANRLLAGALWL